MVFQDLMLVGTALEQSDEELIAQIRAVMEHCRRHPCHVVTGVWGYDDDPRKLWEIPEVGAHLRRLVDFGFIAILVRSTMVRELGAPAHWVDCPAFGAFEVWALGLGLFAGGGSFRMPMAEAKVLLETFARDVFPAAEAALERNLHRFAHVPADPRLLMQGRLRGETS
jgi:hypothetical protein